jgi:hypothetical protein
MNRQLITGAGAIIAVGLLAYAYNVFSTSPLEPTPDQIQQPAPTEQQPAPAAAEQETSAAITTKPIDSTADAVAAVEGFDGDALDIELNKTLSDIDASFQ